MTSGSWVGGFVVAVAAVLASASAQGADILVRTDGVAFEGKLISQSPAEVIFQAEPGAVTSFDRKIVSRLLTVDDHGALITDSAATTQPATRWNVPPEPAAPPLAAHPKEPTYYVIPLHGEVGVTVLASALEKSLADAVARKADVVVLDIDSPGGMVAEATKIIEVLHKYNKRMRIVALAGQDLSAAAILSLSCKEIYVKATGTIGAAVAFNPNNLNLPPKLEEKMQSAWRAVARNSAEEGGHEPLLAEAMIDNTLELHVENVAGKAAVKEGPGERTICRKDKVLTLSSHEAVECGLARGLTDDFRELGTALGMANWTDCPGLAGPLADFLPKKSAAFNTEVDKIQVRLAEHVKEAAAADPSQSTSTVVRTGPIMRRTRFGAPLLPNQRYTVTTAASPARWKANSLRCVVALQQAEADLTEAVSLCQAFGQEGQALEIGNELRQFGDFRAQVYDGRNRYMNGVPQVAGAPVGPALGGAAMPGSAVKTAMVGGPGGGEFTKVGPGGPVLGFQVTFGEWAGKRILRHVEPLFDRPPAARNADPATVVARDGFAVAGVIVNYDNISTVALRVIFARCTAGVIDLTSTYTSDWIGTPDGGPTEQLAGKGETVVGTCGHQGMNLDALGLVVISAEATRDPHRAAQAAPAPASPAAPPANSPTDQTIDMTIDGHTRNGGTYHHDIHVEHHQTVIVNGAPAPAAPATAPAAPPADLHIAAAPNAPVTPSVVEVPAMPPANPTATEKTATAGGTDGRDFERICPNNAPVVGFGVMYGFNHEIRLLMPVSEKQPIRDGCVAREGFAVAGLLVNADKENIYAVRIIFARNNGGVIDRSSTYMSDWLGTPRDVPTVQLGGKGETVVGIYGREDRTCKALGLVVTPPEVVKESHRALAEVLGNGPAPNAAAPELRLARDSSVEHGGGINCLAVSPDGKIMITAGDNRIIRIWDLSQRPPKELSHVDSAHPSAILGMALSPDGKLLAVGGWNKVVKLWELSNGQLKERASLTGHLSDVRAMTFAADSKTLITGGNDGMIFIWDCSGDNPEEVTSFRAGMNGLGITAVALSPDGKTLALATNGSLLSLWDISVKRPVERFHLAGHAGFIHVLAFSPDGRTLASGAGDKSLRLWSLGANPQIFRILQGHADEVNAIAFSGDGRLMASAGSLGDIFVWDAATGTQLIQKQRAAELRGVALRRDDAAAQGAYELIEGSTDGNAYLDRISAAPTRSAPSPATRPAPAVPSSAGPGAAGKAPVAAPARPTTNPSSAVPRNVSAVVPGNAPLPASGNAPAPAAGNVAIAADLLKEMVVPNNAQFVGGNLLLSSGVAKTPAEIKVPFRADVVVETDSTNIRLGYARGMVIFNWEANRTMLRYHDPAKGAVSGFDGKGNVPVNQFVKITWIVSENGSTILVDGEERARVQADYRKLSAPLTIQPAFGSHLTIKSFTVVPAQ